MYSFSISSGAFFPAQISHNSCKLLQVSFVFFFPIQNTHTKQIVLIWIEKKIQLEFFGVLNTKLIYIKKRERENVIITINGFWSSKLMLDSRGATYCSCFNYFPPPYFSLACFMFHTVQNLWPFTVLKNCFHGLFSLFLHSSCLAQCIHEQCKRV